jgi:hypothetical protein
MVVALALASCSAPPSHTVSDGGPISKTSCGPNLKPYKTACIPILDDCPESHVPVPGGGCKRVGVTECTVNGGPGLEAPPDWTCRPIGPPRTCLPGWALTKKDNVCEPVVPEGKCPQGTMPVIGKTECQPVGECGTGRWGSIKPSHVTVYVDGAARGPTFDGTKARPFRTIGEAVKAAPDGAKIAVAAGTYTEDVVLDRPVTLEGVCAQKVRIEGQKKFVPDPLPPGQLPAAAILVNGAASVCVRGVTVTGAGEGVSILDGEASLRRVVAESCAAAGIRGLRSRLLVQDSLVRGNTMGGVSSRDATVTVRRSAVVDNENAGIVAARVEAPTALIVQDTVVRRNRWLSVFVGSAEGRIERTLVQETVPRTSGIDDSYGLMASSYLPGHLAHVIARDVVLADNHSCGAGVVSGRLDIARTVIRDSKSLPDGRYGQGIFVADKFGLPGELTVRDSLVARNRDAAIGLWSAVGKISRSVVRDTLPGVGGHRGHGILAGIGFMKTPVTLAVTDSLLVGHRQHGVHSVDADTTIQRSVIRDPHPKEGVRAAAVTAFGQYVLPRKGRLVLRDSSLLDNICTGVEAFWTDVVVERSVIRGTRALLLDNVRGEAGKALGIFGPGQGRPVSATVRDTLIAENESVGAYLEGPVDARLERVSVSPRPTSVYGGGGLGLLASDLGTGRPLQIEDSRIGGASLAGIYLASQTRAYIRRSIVQDTRTGLGVFHPHQLKEGFGDGLTVMEDAALVLEDSLVSQSARAGALFFGGGTVRRSVFRGGLLSIAIEQGGDPEIAGSNVLENNTEDRVAIGTGMQAPPVPLPPVPKMP